MAQVVIALGSNLGDRRNHLTHAKIFLSGLSISAVSASSIYETEPVGEASTHMYFNAVCAINTNYSPMVLLDQLKAYEQEHGRDSSLPRWANRTIDLDIIDYGKEIISRQRLVVPHPEYTKRLFVLEPLRELFPEWIDTKSGLSIQDLISAAPKISVLKTELNW